MYRQPVIILALAAIMLIGLPAYSVAQSGSYFETIYQAKDSALSQVENEQDPYLAGESVDIFADTPVDLPDQKLIDNSEVRTEEKIQDIISGLVRILTAKMTGIQIDLSKIKIVTCKKVTPPTGTGTGTATATNTSTSTSTNTGTNTGTATGTGTGTATSTSTSTNTATNTGTSTGTGTGTGADMQVNSTGLIGNHQAINGSSSWTQAQKDEANAILRTLPMGFRNCTTKFVRENDNTVPGALGWCDLRGGVYLADCSVTGRSFKGPFIHEMAHNFSAKNPAVTNAWKQQFWTSGQVNPPSTSSYGNVSPEEDISESVRTYWQIGPQMKTTHPDRYEFIKKNIMEGIEFGYNVDN